MSETHDISEIDTRNIPSVPGKTEFPLDFGPLLDDDTEDFEFTPPPAKRRSARKRWLMGGIIVLVLVLIGGGILTYLNVTKPAPVTYTQTAVTTGNLVVATSGTGPVQAGAVYNLNFSSSATVETLNVQVGQQVTKGQTLATIDPTTLQAAVTQAQNSVNAAQTSLNNADTSLSNTTNQEDTSMSIAYLNEQTALQNCVTSNGSSGSGSGGSGQASATPAPTPTPNAQAIANCKALARDQYEQSIAQANSSIDNANNQVTSAQQQLTAAQNNLQTAKINLKGATMTAPANGTIESINGQVGETAGGGGGGGSSSSSGSSNSSAFIVLVDASTLNIAAQISEANIASVAVNQPATFTVEAYPSKTYHAVVTGIDTLGSSSSSVVTYLVNLAVDMQSIGTDHVYPGMTATVDITTAERISTLLVPSTALTFYTTAIQDKELNASDLRSLLTGGSTTTGSPTTGSRGILVELKNGQLTPVLVTTGLTNGSETEILSGISEGTEVVTASSATTTSSSTGTGTGRSGGGGFGGGGFGGGGFGGGGGGR